MIFRAWSKNNRDKDKKQFLKGQQDLLSKGKETVRKIVDLLSYHYRLNRYIYNTDLAKDVADFTKRRKKTHFIFCATVII